MSNFFSLFTILIAMFSWSNEKQKDNMNVTSNEVVCENDTCRKVDQYLTHLSQTKNFSGGLLIIKNGQKIFSKGYGYANKELKLPFTPNTLASMGSITKLFTAAAIMKLCEMGKLSVKDPLKKFFKNVPADKESITIHQLLTHSSGFHEFLKNDGGDYEKIETKDYLNRAFSEPLAFKPGEKAVYTNVGMSILAIIVEQVSAMDYETFLKKNLFDKAGITNIGYHVQDADTNIIAHGYQNGKDWGTIPQHIVNGGGGPYWNLKGNGGLEASLNDMYLWINAFTNHTILADSTIQKMFTAQIEEADYGGNSYFGYGCNISKSRRNTKMIDNGGSNGIYFARLVRLPEEGVVFYMVTNESAINTNMVLPNVSQLYFYGNIMQDAISAPPAFISPVSEIIYKIIDSTKTTDLGVELQKANIKISNDMILYEVGQQFIKENKTNEALTLYQYYTKTYVDIVVAWNDLGDVYMMKNNKDEAKKCYEQALKLRPGNPRALQNLEKLK